MIEIIDLREHDRRVGFDAGLERDGQIDNAPCHTTFLYLLLTVSLLPAYSVACVFAATHLKAK
jgi:hypothetical protein